MADITPVEGDAGTTDPPTPVNKVVYDNETLIDLTSDTVQADKMLTGYTAHTSDGTVVSGTLPAGWLEAKKDNYDNICMGVMSTDILMGLSPSGGQSLAAVIPDATFIYFPDSWSSIQFNWTTPNFYPMFKNMSKVQSVYGKNINDINTTCFDSTCTALSNLSFPNLIGVNIGYVFAGLSKVSRIYFPKLTGAYQSAFIDMPGLLEASLPKLAVLSPNLFRYCSKLPRIILPNVSTMVSYTMLFSYQTFANCLALSYVELPKCNRIYSSVFFECPSLRTLKLGNVTAIYPNYGFSRLSSLYLLGSSVPWLANQYHSGGCKLVNPSEGKIYVPESMYSLYQEAINSSTTNNAWRLFSSNIVSYSG